MKKIVLMMVALLSMTAVQAQESDNNKNQQQFRGPRQMTPEQMTERMTNDLKLNDEQKTKVLALNKEYEKKLKEILTEDQYKKYQKSRPGHRGFGRGPGRGGRPGGFGQGGPRPQD